MIGDDSEVAFPNHEPADEAPPQSCAHLWPVLHRPRGEAPRQPPPKPPRTQPRTQPSPVRPAPKQSPTQPHPSEPPSAPEPSPTSVTERKPPIERVSFPVAPPPPTPPARPQQAMPARPEASAPVPSAPSTAEAGLQDAAQAQPALEAKEPEAAERLSPVFGYLLYLALAMGTLSVDVETRYTILWTALIVLGGFLVLVDSDRSLGEITSVGLTWGMGIGFIIGLPMLIVAARGLAQTSSVLLPYSTLPALFQAVAIIGPLGETLFYRGAMQGEHGLTAGALSASLGSVLLYWPAAMGYASVLTVAVALATALAFTFGYVRTRYGLAAACACQVMSNLMLLFLPRLIT
jgi:membrane protease YdiL (CAAX protease family)